MKEQEITIEDKILKEYRGKETSVTVPEGITTIDWAAFCHCTKLEHLTLPESLEIIDGRVFRKCTELKDITFPKSMEKIGDYAFAECRKLKKVVIPESLMLSDEVFFEEFPPVLIDRFEELKNNMTDALVKELLLNHGLWQTLSIEGKADLFIKRHKKGFFPVYLKNVKDPEKLGRGILVKLKQKASAKNCGAAGVFMEIFMGMVTDGLLRELYEKIESAKSGATALKKIKQDELLMARISKAKENCLKTAEQWVLDHSDLTAPEIEVKFKNLYGAPELPDLSDRDGNILNKIVLKWILTVHEKEDDELKVDAEYKKPGVEPLAEELLELIDMDSFNRVIRTLADKYLKAQINDKKMYLAYPICRYGTEELMLELKKKAPFFKTLSSGNNAPPLRTLRRAAIYSKTKAAVMIADQYQDLDQYAKIRGICEESVREQFFLNLGLNEKTEGIYEPGNEMVTDYLFQIFLDGRLLDAKQWENLYLKNPLLKAIAKSLVWQQGSKSFVIGDAGLTQADGSEYQADKNDVKVAHPMEMGKEEIGLWKEYFTAHHITQPFTQLVEPVIDPATIRTDRYSGRRIPLYQFMEQEKHGITIEDFQIAYEDYEVKILMKDCDAIVSQKELALPYNPQNNIYMVDEFSFKEYTRQVNHIVAYLDKITAKEYDL